MNTVLSIAGSDPSGGAGIQADLKVFTSLNCYGMAAITSLTAQNTRGVQGVEMVSPEFLDAQLSSIFDDIKVDAIKIGMVGDVQLLQVICNILKRYQVQHIVLDPVMVASSGDRLVSSDVLDVMMTELVPLSTLVTPNIPETEMFLRKAVLDQEQGALDLFELFSGTPILLKGGHLHGDIARDILVCSDGVHFLDAPRIIDADNVHGTGCALSSALACHLAQGFHIKAAAEAAKTFVREALIAGQGMGIGYGANLLRHNYKLSA